MQFNIYQAKTRFSELVEQASRGSTVVIAKAGKPVAKLVPLRGVDEPRIRYGGMKGEFMVPSDFDASLDDETLASFEGRAVR